MTLSKMHAKMQEAKKKVNSVDARRFNSRSREKMEREIRAIKKSARTLERKSTKTKHLYKGMYSKEELDFANAEKVKFREECLSRRSIETESIDSSACAGLPCA